MILSLLSLLSTAIGGYFYYSSLRENVLRDASKRADVNVKIAANRISYRLTEYQKAAKSVAGLKDMQSALTNKNVNTLSDANSILDHFQNSLDVDVCYLMDKDGNAIASSNRNAQDSFVGKNYAFRPYFQQAINGSPAIYMALGVTSKKRGIYYSHPVYSEGRNDPSGVLVIKASVEHIEKALERTPEGNVLMTDAHGVIFASSRPEWLFNFLWELSPEKTSEIEKTQQFGSGPWKWTGLKRQDNNYAVDKSGARYMIHQMKISNYPGWNIIYLWDINEVSGSLIDPLFRTVGYVIVALCLFIGGAVTLLYTMASRDIIARRQAEDKLSKAYGELETRVLERTADLNRVNLQLKAEIWERSRVEKALTESEAKYKKLSQEFQALLDTIPDSLTLQSPDLKIIWANRGAALCSGKEVSDLVGQYCFTVWHNRSKPCEHCPALKSIKTGKMENMTVHSPDGRIRDLRTVPIKDETGNTVNIIEVGRDVTEHRRLEEQLRHAQKLEAVGQLAGGVAHDFNNILTAIIGYGSLLKLRMKEGDPLQHNVENILALAERGANITHSLLAFSRKQVMKLGRANLNRIVENAADFLQRLIGETIELKIKIAEEDLSVMVDAGQLEQVLFNLATNARDAMHGAGILT
ncbi:MAG: PAS domain-containing protein, partial [Nitrospirae bacterium]|nr:PAS domain-containing protein [Nitrospirota bacterium]